MTKKKPTLDYARLPSRRWPWWADLLFAIAVVTLAAFILFIPS